MNIIKDVTKLANNSLKFLENDIVRLVLIAVVVLYCAGVAPELNSAVSQLLDSTLAKLIMLLVILYVSAKDTTLALMLTIALLLSLQVNAKNQVNNAIAEGMKGAKHDAKHDAKENEAKEAKEAKEGKEENNIEKNNAKDMEEMTNPTGANTPDSCLVGGSRCSDDLSNACTGVRVWGSENNAQGLDCNGVRGYSGNDYDQGAPF